MSHRPARTLRASRAGKDQPAATRPRSPRPDHVGWRSLRRRRRSPRSRGLRRPTPQQERRSRGLRPAAFAAAVNGQAGARRDQPPPQGRRRTAAAAARHRGSVATIAAANAPDAAQNHQCSASIREVSGFLVRGSVGTAAYLGADVPLLHGTGGGDPRDRRVDRPRGTPGAAVGRDRVVGGRHPRARAVAALLEGRARPRPRGPLDAGGLARHARGRHPDRERRLPGRSLRGRSASTSARC